jgi:hypothetical protein
MLNIVLVHFIRATRNVGTLMKDTPHRSSQIISITQNTGQKNFLITKKNIASIKLPPITGVTWLIKLGAGGNQPCLNSASRTTAVFFTFSVITPPK